MRRSLSIPSLPVMQAPGSGKNSRPLLNRVHLFGLRITFSNSRPELHATVGNEVTEKRFIVFGAGSNQLLSAAVFALSPENTTSPARVVASVPYYMLNKEQTQYYSSAKFEFDGHAYTWRNRSDASSTNMIELVTSPNNPDGQLKQAVLHGPNVKTIYDRAYYWPHYTPIPAPADEDVMVFTLSMLTGHAGTRLGWAVIEDETVFNRMTTHMHVNSLGMSKDAQLRAFRLLKAVLEEVTEIFDFAYKTMKSSKVRQLSQGTSLNLTSMPGTYRGHLYRYPTPFYLYILDLNNLMVTAAYAWLKCEREEDEDCFAVLEAANIVGC
ncbi:tryptophan aminotransferase-related protein 4 [Hibiscus syriacus]|uniref:Tryptophan aminotransferase-related protein 4 n=1 Tax=Hibiscus syriacus TaxID=106335 RepID=A0A6A3BTV6_HIBSY|nr:tryptophan aminotransferase-related protein 4 [Hibiscus syriacus]